jgi:hypothetical protein
MTHQRFVFCGLTLVFGVVLLLSPGDAWAIEWGVQAADAGARWLFRIAASLFIIALIVWSIAAYFGKAGLGSLALIVAAGFVTGGAFIIGPQVFSLGARG